ncbi:WS/DGAT/MGAT family O-acyltransferase [Kibdelosporangium phytohabitans]|uniref:Diacylglycerol O-acyltransferase n=1 Tax=Kibdelosporangium phytohabitans TaxID=860235 RepID=A0A0N9IAU2_9PSEU|nr:wax ester/triacylglycerol synthase family O-acyltransferase [Kibdelosporangium phytohabitans]ALG15598.1 diacylglycerol O-acyltransferase [Kibdelosporangium phytohabitans]
MPLMPVQDSMFLLAESREHPMHVGGLQLYSLPDDAGPDYLSQIYHSLVADEQSVQPLFRRRPRRPVSSLGQWSWTSDDQLDMEYHVRLTALPRPGRVRELLELTSRLHGSLLDRHRPLWEFSLIEGLEGNRFATYSKVHHALMDGVSSLILASRALSTNPDDRDMPPVWAVPPMQRPDKPSGSGGPLELLENLRASAADIAGVLPALVRSANTALREQASVLPFQAPRSIFNVQITGARRFAAQRWPVDRVKAIRRATGATLNDVVLAMCSGALRRYLLELGALPDRPLISMVPVSLRAKQKRSEASGNSVGAILVNLGTHLEDPAQRFVQIQQSAQIAKRSLAELSPLQILALSGLTMAPLAFAPLPGFVQTTPPPFNLIISNVPGSPRPLYWNGAKLDGMYPLSIPYDGQALNITITSYADQLQFGLTGCRRNVPHLQRLLGHLEDALAELEKAVL